MTTVEQHQVATTILQQLGGKTFIRMTGVHSIFVTEDGVQFRIGRNLTKANRIQIALDPSDTYSVIFWRIRMGRNPSATEVHRESGIYCDGLQDTFSRITGLHTHL